LALLPNLTSPQGFISFLNTLLATLSFGSEVDTYQVQGNKKGYHPAFALRNHWLAWPAVNRLGC
jgi:hypothetical protein